MNRILLVLFFAIWIPLDLPMFVLYRLGHPVGYYRTRLAR